MAALGNKYTVYVPFVALGSDLFLWVLSECVTITAIEGRMTEVSPPAARVLEMDTHTIQCLLASVGGNR